MEQKIEFNSEIKRLVDTLPNDTDLGRAIRQLVNEANCCAIKSNHRKSGENNKMICIICGKLINHQ